MPTDKRLDHDDLMDHLESMAQQKQGNLDIYSLPKFLENASKLTQSTSTLSTFELYELFEKLEDLLTSTDTTAYGKIGAIIEIIIGHQFTEINKLTADTPEKS